MKRLFAGQRAAVMGVAAVLALGLTVESANADVAWFNYQGRLQENGAPANGDFEMRFGFFEASFGGPELSWVSKIVTVENGLFTTPLAVPDTLFDGGERWLEIRLRRNAGDPYILLSDRQWITPTPMAVHSQNTRGIYVQDSPAFAGIGRDWRVTTSERFGVYSPSTSFGGMYTSTATGGRPFYGYANDANVMAFHYVDAASKEWRLNVASSDRLAVQPDGALRLNGQGSGEPTLVVDCEPNAVNFYRVHNNTPEPVMSFTRPFSWPVVSFPTYVGVNQDYALVPLHVREYNDATAIFDRHGSDGIVITISKTTNPMGTISVAGSTVSYNAFTGSHYALSDETLERACC